MSLINQAKLCRGEDDLFQVDVDGVVIIDDKAGVVAAQ